MGRIRSNWQKLPSVVRKPAILIAGSIIVVAGIAMLVLPGPGWAAIFLGFAILATEFSVAKRFRDRLILILKRMTAAIQARLKAMFKNKT